MGLVPKPQVDWFRFRGTRGIAPGSKECGKSQPLCVVCIVSEPTKKKNLTVDRTGSSILPGGCSEVEVEVLVSHSSPRKKKKKIER